MSQSTSAIEDYNRHATEYLTGERLDFPRLPTPPEAAPTRRDIVVNLAKFRRQREQRKEKGV